MRKIEIIYKPLEGEMLLEALPLLLEQDVRMLQKKRNKGYAAVYGRAAVGVLLCHVQGKYLIMDKVAVLPQYQRMGVGTGLLKTLCRLAESLKLELVFSFEGRDNQEPFYGFLASTGLFYMERQGGFTAVLRERDLKALMEKYPQTGGEDTHFFDLSNKLREDFLDQMAQVYPQIAEEIRDHNKDYSRRLCCCSVAHGQVQAACFIKDFGESMELKLLYSLPERGVLAAKALLQSVANLDRERLVPLIVAPTGEASAKIIEGLCPSYQIVNYIYMAYYLGKPETGR